MSFSIKYEKSKKQAGKKRKKKESETERSTTVDAKHKEYMSRFDQMQNKVLPSKKRQLAQKEKTLVKYQTKKDLEPIEYRLMGQLKKEINELQNEIESIEKHKDENEYLLNTVDLLKQYHESKSGGSGGNSKSNASNASDGPNGPNGPNGSDQSNVSDNDDTKETSAISADITSFFGGGGGNTGKITEYIPIQTSGDRNRGEIYHEYMKCADPTYIRQKQVSEKDESATCKCGVKASITYDYPSGRNICETCGTILVHFFDSAFISYKESQDHDIPVDFPYIRMNHFNELIAQFQAKEQTDIPEEVFEKLEEKFKTDVIDDYDELCYKYVKNKLRELGMENMYEHIPYIIYKFNGQPPPVLSLEQEQRFRKMFKQIQGPFERCKHLNRKNRKNFLSYHYVFYKFAELLEMDHLLQYFRLLQSREKLFLQDRVWEAICKIMEWQFIPTL